AGGAGRRVDESRDARDDRRERWRIDDAGWWSGRRPGTAWLHVRRGRVPSSRWRLLDGWWLGEPRRRVERPGGRRPVQRRIGRRRPALWTAIGLPWPHDDGPELHLP